jgi:hypothetical protein
MGSSALVGYSGSEFLCLFWFIQASTYLGYRWQLNGARQMAANRQVLGVFMRWFVDGLVCVR